MFIQYVGLSPRKSRDPPRPQLTSWRRGRPISGPTGADRQKLTWVSYKTILTNQEHDY